MSDTCQKKIPLPLVLLDNIPTVLMYILGSLLILRISFIGGFIFAVYTISTFFWFWYLICPWCPLFGTRICPCGYGKISSLLTIRRTEGVFRKHFGKFILYVFPAWFVPFGLGVFSLILRWSLPYLVLLCVFSIDGFLIIPLVSRIRGCKDCPVRSECPWMSQQKKQSS